MQFSVLEKAQKGGESMQSNMKRFVHGFFGFFLSMVLVFGAVLTYVPQAQAAGKVKSVTVRNLPAKTLTLKKGKTKTLKTKVTVQGKKVSKQVTFKSSKPKVATVTAKGQVKAKKDGKTNIVITSKANKKKKVVIKVTVGTPAGKVSLNTASASLAQGASTTLKASVTPKKASNKKVVWSSSNKSVATVNSKGVVKAVKAGTAKITATAADGSGKMASCTVTVTNPADAVIPVKVASVSALNPRTLKVSLTGAQALAASNFTVKVKETAQGAYNKVCAIDNISTGDRVTYTVVLKSESRLYDQEKVQVTVTGLTGTGTSAAETVYNEGTYSYQNHAIYSAAYNKDFSEYLYLSGVGYSSYTVTGLPQGISYSMNESYTEIRFSGKPTQKGTVTSKVTTKDELGNTYEYTIVWLIYSEDTIAAAFSPSNLYLQEDGSVYLGKNITVYGGSGNYQYSISGDSHGLQISEYGYIYGYISAAGNFTVNVVVQDTENAAGRVTVPVVISVSNSRTVTGTVKDARGNGISGADVIFTNKDKGKRSWTGEMAYTDDQGRFTAYVVDGTYDVEASIYETETELYSQTFQSNRNNFDITLPVYGFTVASNNAQIDAGSFGSWEDERGITYGWGSKLYLETGTYTLTTEGYQGRYAYQATLNVNVNASTTAATASVTAQEAVILGDIALDQPVEVEMAGNYAFFRFVPSEEGYYYFYTSGDIDTYGRLENEQGYYLDENDDGGIDYNFEIGYYCQADTAYYVGVRGYDSDSAGSVTLQVSTQSSRPAEGGY